MTTDRILSERGLVWRQQCGFTPTWGLRRPMVMDLPEEALVLCRKNPLNYGKRLLRNGNILFPAADFSKPYTLPKPEFEKGFAASVPENNRFYAELAKKMGGRIISDQSPLPASEPVVIFGSSAENRHACRLALLQKVMANGLFPGKGGWSLEFPYGPVPVAVVCCDETSAADFLKHWTSARTPRSVPGPHVPGIYHDPEKVLTTQVNDRYRFPVDSFEEFVSKVSGAFDCGGPEVGRDNGHCTVPPLVRSYYAYFYTGDRRFLEAFKEIFFALVRYYLTLPGGASYISDYDFYLGALTNCFAAAERDEIFSEDDRLLGAAFLLSSFRLIEKYGKSQWPLRECVLRINHETFPAINCYWGARYFEECYNLKKDAARWRYYAKTAFGSGEICRVWRQRENSGDYQWIAPSHKLQWDLAEKGKPSAAFRKMSEAVACVTDNSGRQVCYGDAQALNGANHKDMLQALAQISGDQRAARLSAQLDANGASCLPVPGWGCFLHPVLAKPEPVREKGWKLFPLVPHIFKRHPKAILSKTDKAVFRDEKRYLLFEPCSCDSHRHQDTGAILAWQYGKHLWLVDNGYGFDVRNTPVDMVEAYNSREIGPHCHNTLIFRDKTGAIIYPPEFSVFRRSGNTLHCEMELPGVTWYRQVKLLDNGLQITDEVTVTGETNIATVECQFNALGESVLKKGVWLLEQKEGGSSELRFRDPARCKVFEDSYLTKGWQSALKKSYPWAAGDIKQLRRIAPLDKEKGKLLFESVFTSEDPEKRGDK